VKLTRFDRFTLSLAPRWTMQRLRARVAADLLARNYEAATFGRRTSGWARNVGDANAVNAVALGELRLHARDLVRNNGWARKAQRVIANSAVGWGLTPKASAVEDPQSAKAADAVWKAWAGSSECDSEGRLNICGIQHLVMRSVAESGEVLIRRRFRRPTDGLTIPIQIQVLEADYLDTSKDGLIGIEGGPIINGVEFDAIGRRVAYWLFPAHPGSTRLLTVSKRVPADEVIHVYKTERPGQVRGVSWFGAAIVPLKDFDEYEDATLMRQKIAACFAGFMTDDGTGATLGAPTSDPTIETLEPGQIAKLPPGKQITFANPPNMTQDSFNMNTLRKIASALSVTYEDLTGDYSQVNFSSARMARLAFWDNVVDWRWNMLIPILCDGVWAWAMESAVAAGLLKTAPRADWSAPAMPMIEPDKEGLAISRLIRNGVKTYSEMVREQGGDPEAHWTEYAADQAKLDALGIKLDSDVRAVSQAGLTQERVGAGGGGSASSDGRSADVEPELDAMLADAVREALGGGA
jgi:lambda family phage portal protein